MEKAFNTFCMAVGFCLLTAILVVMWSPNTRKSLIDQGAKSFFSEEDYEALKNPEAANKKSMEKFSREAFENTRKNQPAWMQNQPTWTPNWRK